MVPVGPPGIRSERSSLSQFFPPPGDHPGGSPRSIHVVVWPGDGPFVRRRRLQENTVAALNGVYNGLQDLNASDYQVQINWGDGGDWVQGHLARNNRTPRSHLS